MTTRLPVSQRILIIGASRGIGAYVAQHLVDQGHDVVSVSRTPAKAGTWVEADVSAPIGLTKIFEHVGEAPLDALLYLGGVWEDGAFVGDFDFLKSPDAETRVVLAVNLIAPIELVKGLAGNLKASANPRAIFIGALSGNDNAATPEVANTASKFGLKGALQALRKSLPDHGIAFTLINPGNMATEEVEQDIAEGTFDPQTPVPLSDLAALIDCVLALSPVAEVRQIDLAQRTVHASA